MDYLGGKQECGTITVRTAMDMFNFEHSMGFPLTRLDLWVRSYLLVA
jgi:hypothetical protein